ncbi:hypothetical protein QJQ45_018015 [Haematococcus lacustris]|nr:hypothetical protein QJQ45_018015 [Haematococcus lacustris]
MQLGAAARRRLERQPDFRLQCMSSSNRLQCMCCSACVAVDKQQQQAVVHEQQCMDNKLYVCSNASLFQQSAAWLS